jgi:ankyrin repeat protein
MTALHQAASQGAIKMMELLLANRADVNAASNSGYMPLHGAVSYGNMDTKKLKVEILLKSGANVNAKTSSDGETPLHKAISRGDIEIVKLLLNYGADVNAKSKYGVTALHFARNSNAIAQLLVEHGAK